MALPEIQVEPPQTVLPLAVNGRWAGYRAILGARMKELWREPEVIFWVFVFPLLLALGLGIAFRNKPADLTPIAVVNNSHAQSVLEMLQRSPSKECSRPLPSGPVFARCHFRRGRTALPLRPCPARERAGTLPGR